MKRSTRHVAGRGWWRTAVWMAVAAAASWPVWNAAAEQGGATRGDPRRDCPVACQSRLDVAANRGAVHPAEPQAAGPARDALRGLRP